MIATTLHTLAVATIASSSLAQIPRGITYRSVPLPEGPAIASGLLDQIGTFDGSMVAAGYLDLADGTRRGAIWRQSLAGPPTLAVIQSPTSAWSQLSLVIDTPGQGTTFAGEVEDAFGNLIPMIWLNNGQAPLPVKTTHDINHLRALEYASCQGALVIAAFQADVNGPREAVLFEYDDLGRWTSELLESPSNQRFSEPHAVAVDESTCEITVGGESGDASTGDGVATLWRGQNSVYQKVILPLTSSLTGTSVATAFYEKGNKAAGLVAGSAYDNNGNERGVVWEYINSDEIWVFSEQLNPAPGFAHARVSDIAEIDGDIVVVGDSYNTLGLDDETTIWQIGSSGQDGVCIESFFIDAGECRFAGTQTISAAGDIGLNMIDHVDQRSHATVMRPAPIAHLRPDPGDAPGPNRLTVQGLLPNETCYFVAGLQSGYTPVSVCTLGYVDLSSPELQVIGRARADDSGTASLIINLSLGWDGRVVGFQGISPSSCGISNVVWNEF